MNYHIFYVEDEENLATIVRETMVLQGFTVEHEKDGQQVIKSMEDFSPDICVLDVMLPNVDGFSLGKLIRKIYPQMPIIFLTAKSQTKDVLEGFASGGTDYLKKPFSLEELMARIKARYNS
ncbi:MAG TPA: response regulator [Edaphocola sp.]|nr:response regulator [Edaphocola sp.]